MREKFEKMMALYEELRQEIRVLDPHLYERWKAGGYLIDDDTMSVYPTLAKCVERLEESDEPEEPDGDAPHEHRWGPVQHARLTGNPHRKFQVPGCKTISQDLDDEE